MFPRLRVQRNKVRILVTSVAFLILVGIFLLFRPGTSEWTQVVGTIAATFGAGAIWYQLKGARDLAEAEFIVSLNESFSSTEGIRSIYMKLEQSRNGSADPFNDDDDIVGILQYLSFFETLYTLLSRGVLKFEMVDDLFSYRFFVAVHNPHVQRREIIKDAPYYRNIFALHKKWSAHRTKLNREIPFLESCLTGATPDYEALAATE